MPSASCWSVCWGVIFSFRLEHVRVLQEREKARYVVDSYATKIQYVVANAFSSAYLVEALLRQGEGRISEFYSYAEELVKMHLSTITSTPPRRRY